MNVLDGIRMVLASQSDEPVVRRLQQTLKSPRTIEVDAGHYGDIEDSIRTWRVRHELATETGNAIRGLERFLENMKALPRERELSYANFRAEEFEALAIFDASTHEIVGCITPPRRFRVTPDTSIALPFSVNGSAIDEGDFAFTLRFDAAFVVDVAHVPSARQTQAIGRQSEDGSFTCRVSVPVSDLASTVVTARTTGGPGCRFVIHGADWTADLQRNKES